MRYRDLLQSCLNGDVLNISPVAAWQHKPLIDQTVDDFARATAAEQQQFDFDFAKLTPASTWQSIDHGLIDCWNRDYLGRRQIAKHNIMHVEDWARIKQRDPYHGFTGNILQAAKLTKALLPTQVPLLVTVFNPFFQAVQQAGLPFVLQTQQTAPEFLKIGLAALLANTLNLINSFIALGVDGIFFVTQHASRDHLAATIYQDLALQADLTCIKAISQVPFSMLHLHGTNTHWPLFAGVNLPLHCDKTTDTELAQQVNQFNCLAGGLPPDALFLEASVQDITAAVIDKRKQLANNHYIVSPGCTLPLQVKSSHIHAMVASARTAV